MLRPRYHQGWKPSWVGTNKFYLRCEDRQPQRVSAYTFLSRNCLDSVQRHLIMDATRISDGKTVILKRLLEREGPYELQMNRLFSSDPLVSNPRNRCARFLDVIELPNDSPIMVHSHLRPFYDPPFHTENLSFSLDRYVRYALPNLSVNIDCVAQSTRVFNSCMNIMSLIGIYSFVLPHPSG
jgi:hypothetical protein